MIGTTTTTKSVEELKSELARIGALVELAAVREDVLEFDRLTMRERALPLLIRRARTAPHRERLERLDAELDGLVEDRGRAMTEEPPEAPAAMQGTVTPHMVRQRLLDGINRLEAQASTERRTVLERIAKIESGVDA